MSSTGRAEDRQALDDYPTPRWCVHRLLERYSFPAGVWFEPCAGAGSIIRAVNDIRGDVRWRANELNTAYEPVLRAIPNMHIVWTHDARRGAVLDDTEVAITNPPFGPSLEIVEALLIYGALVVILQRLNWAAGPRRSLFRMKRPSAYVLPDRPSYIDTYEAETPHILKPGTDSIEYAWFIFDGRGEFHVLGDTPAEVRAAEIEEGRRLGTRPKRLAKPKRSAAKPISNLSAVPASIDGDRIAIAREAI